VKFGVMLPYHQPVVLAKRLATIDLLSKGRPRLAASPSADLPRPLRIACGGPG